VLCWCSQVIMLSRHGSDVNSNFTQSVILINHNLLSDCGKKDKLSNGINSIKEVK